MAMNPTFDRHLRAFVALATLATAILATAPAHAHKPSNSYLTLSVVGARIEGRWDIALRDLDHGMGLDGDGNGSITWRELHSRQDDVAAYALGRLVLMSDGVPCGTRFRDLRVASHSDGGYAVIGFDASCAVEPRVLGMDYELFFDVDRQHRGIVRIDDAGGTRTAIFSAGDRSQRFDRAILAPSRQLGSAVKLGVEHIFSGIDHLFFLVALLLPAVLVRMPERSEGADDNLGIVRMPERSGRHVRGQWEPVSSLRPAMVGVLKIVTSFTAAHSITLSLSALDVLHLPSRLVESGIAASVVIAALDNVVPVLDDDRWTAAFALGLLHGFGFSATLADLGLPRQNLLLTLFGFNMGVEVGQIAVVAVLLPALYLARRTWAYRRAGLVGGSVVIACIAGVWLVERAFAVRVF
jgi:hypothetical protein